LLDPRYKNHSGVFCEELERMQNELTLKVEVEMSTPEFLLLSPTYEPESERSQPILAVTDPFSSFLNEFEHNIPQVSSRITSQSMISKEIETYLKV